MNSTLRRLDTRVRDDRTFNRKNSELSYSDERDPDQSLSDRLLRLFMPDALDLQLVGRDSNFTVPVESTTAIMPTSLTNEVLSRSVAGSIWRNSTASITMPQSMTTVACTAYSYHNTELNDELPYIQRDGNSLGALGSISALARLITTKGILVDDEARCFFPPLWLPSPEPDSQSSIFVLFNGIPSNTSSQSLSELLDETEQLIDVTTCSLSAYWSTTTAYLTNEEERSQITQTAPIPELNLRDIRNITLNMTGIESINNLELIDYGNQGFEITLAAAFALALSNSPVSAGVGSRMTVLPADQLSEVPTFECQTIWYAYGYCADTTSIRLSLAVIVAYCIITIAYLVYILVTGLSSTAWNSAIELVTLALQSRKPDFPGRTAVGIDSLDTFNQGVGIRVNTDDELELVFASDRDIGSRGLKRIKENTVY
jgi:hypothetical protein